MSLWKRSIPTTKSIQGRNETGIAGCSVSVWILDDGHVGEQAVVISPGIFSEPVVLENCAQI